MKLIKTTLLTAALTAGLSTGAAVAQETNTQAQNSQSPNSQSPNSQSSSAQETPNTTKQVQISEKQVDQFVDAYLTVQLIGQKYQAEIQAAGDQAKAKDLQQEAREKMQTAISDSGIAMQKYREISIAANQNESLRGRISEKLTIELESRKQAQNVDS
jgi:lipopolysaccharide export LptBFGC system permease protein LptF